MFISSVSAAGGLHWIVSASVGLVRDIIVFPAVAALFLACVTKALQAVWPEAVSRLMVQHGIDVDVSIRKSAATDKGSHHVYDRRKDSLPTLAQLDRCTPIVAPGSPPRRTVSAATANDLLDSSVDQDAVFLVPPFLPHQVADAVDPRFAQLP